MALDDSLYELDVRDDKINRYRQERYEASKQGDTDFLDRMDSDQHQELLAVILRHWARIDHDNINAPITSLGFICAINSAIDGAIKKALQSGIDKGDANEHEPDEGPYDTRDEERGCS